VLLDCRFFRFPHQFYIQHPDPLTVVVVFQSRLPLGLSGNDAHEFFEHLMKNYNNVFGTSGDRWIVRVRPDLATTTSSTIEKKKMDGFSDVYRACCAVLGVAARDDIVWDVDHVLFPNVTVLDPREFEQPTESKDLIALFKALMHNSHFKVFVVLFFSVLFYLCFVTSGAGCLSDVFKAQNRSGSSCCSSRSIEQKQIHFFSLFLRMFPCAFLRNFCLDTFSGQRNKRVVAFVASIKWIR
jgi:hypothetical protein